MFENSLMELEEIDDGETTINEIEHEIKNLLKYDIDIYNKFINQIKVEKDKGYHYSLARECKIVELEEQYKRDSFCEHFETCILYKEGKAPIGKTCPFEQYHIEKISFELISELSIDLKKDFIAMQSVSDYVSYSLIKYRAFKSLSASSLISVTKEETKFGTNYTKTLNPVLEAIDIAEKNMAKIKKELVATRETKLHFNIEAAKINVKEIEDKKKTLREMDKLSSIRNNQLDIIIDIEE